MSTSDMSDAVDQLRAVLQVDTDVALARELGIERSTVSQWRRRGSLPRRYQEIIDTVGGQEILSGVHANRRQIYGDGPGKWFVKAALSVIPTAALDFPALSPALLGEHREKLILNLVPVVLDVCRSDLGITRVSTEPEYLRLVEALNSPKNRHLIENALAQPTL